MLDFSQLNFKELITVSLVLFSVIDILGSIPIILDLRKKGGGTIHSGKATFVSGVLMILFLLYGELILGFLGLDVVSFSLAGAVIIFLIGIEMVLGVHLFKDSYDAKTSSIVPLAFPLIAGAGTMTTLISLRAQYAMLNVMVGVVINLIFVYIVLKTSGWIERKLGTAGANILRKVFGIVLLAIAIKMFKNALVSIR